MKSIDCDSHYWPLPFLCAIKGLAKEDQDRILGHNAADLFGLQGTA